MPLPKAQWRLKAAAHSGAVQRFAHKVEAGAALELKLGSSSVRLRPPPVVWACSRGGSAPSKASALRCWPAPCPRHRAGCSGVVRQMGQKRLAQLRVQAAPSEDRQGVLPGGQGRPPANRAVGAASSSAGERSAPRPGAWARAWGPADRSCMMQMPDRPYSVNCTSPVSAARCVPIEVSREAVALAGCPKGSVRFATCKAVRG